MWGWGGQPQGLNLIQNLRMGGRMPCAKLLPLSLIKCFSCQTFSMHNIEKMWNIAQSGTWTRAQEQLISAEAAPFPRSGPTGLVGWWHPFPIPPPLPSPSTSAVIQGPPRGTLRHVILRSRPWTGVFHGCSPRESAPPLWPKRAVVSPQEAALTPRRGVIDRSLIGLLPCV